jgi:hypothetical protein
MLNEGLTVQEIARKMLLPVQRVNLLLAFESKREIPSHIEIEAAREKWLRALELSSITSARKNNYGLYQFLRKYDHDWMMSQRRPRQTKIDLEKRDAEWSSLLEQAEVRIRSKYPGRRIAKTLMVKEAGLNLRLMAELDKFPKCKNVLERLAEVRKSTNNKKHPGELQKELLKGIAGKVKS